MADTAPILVVGATGRVGREVVAQLRHATWRVRALSRRPAATELSGDIEIAVGDLTRPESLDPALAGVRTVFLVWTAPFTTAPDVVARLAASADRIVVLSAPYQTPHPFFQQPNPLATLHEELDRLVINSGLETTIIRPGMFAANAIDWWAPQIRAGNVVRWPYGAVETAPIDERDIAAVAVRALVEDGHAGRDYVVTGPESLSQEEQVHGIGRAIGRTLSFHDITPDQFRRGASGPFPARAAEMLLAAWGAAAGISAHVTSTVADVTGSPARTWAEWAAANAGAFS